jgi:hypothetical protein
MSNKRTFLGSLAILGLAAIFSAFPMADLSAREMPVQQQPGQASKKWTPMQEKWLKSTTQERILLSEQVGEQGAREFAQRNGLKAIFDGTKGKGIPQGLDQVYFNKHGGITVLEAKANGSPLNRGYGYMQGSIEHTLKSAEHMLKSPKASPLQKRAAQLVIEAAAKGQNRLTVQVVRTYHVLGKTSNIVAENVASSGSQHQKLAQEIIKQNARYFGNILHSAGKSATPVSKLGIQPTPSGPEKSAVTSKAPTPPAEKSLTQNSPRSNTGSKATKTTSSVSSKGQKINTPGRVFTFAPSPPSEKTGMTGRWVSLRNILN